MFLNESKLKKQIPPGIQLEYHSTLDSTQNRVSEIISQPNAPIFVITEQQTHGRGRRGNKWIGEGGNLFLSAGFCPQSPPQALATFTLRMGIAICEAINQLYRTQIQLKWPNDLYFQDKKLGGMLTECAFGKLNTLVFGIGINVNQTSFHNEINATSLNLILKNPIDLNNFAAKIISIIKDTYTSILSKPNDTEWLKTWQKLDYLYGKTIKVESDSQTLQGIAQGISPKGALLLRSDNTQHSILSGTIVEMREKTF